MPNIVDKLVRSPKRWSPGIFLAYQLLVLSLLAWLLFRYAVAKPEHVVSFPFTRILPLWVPLGGALGGSTISLVGIAHHASGWDGPGYAFWHLARPVLGLISGSIAVLALIFVLKGVAPDVIPKPGTAYDPSGIAVMFVIAFVVGYREETFRALVSRVVDVILGPGDADAGARGTLVPRVVTLTSPSQPLTPQTGTVLLVNTSRDTWALSNDVLTMSPASFTAVFASPAPLQPNDSAAITVTWTPTPGTTGEIGILSAAAGGVNLTSTVNGRIS